MTTYAVPSLSRAYSARGNVPFGSNNTTALLIHQFAAWSLYMHLTNQHSTGTASAIARAANSVWTVRHSCDGTTAGTAGDGVDRWGPTFTPSKLVRGLSGSAASHMVLRNAASGLECCISLNSTTDGTGLLSFTRVSAPFAAGTTTARPLAPGTTEEWCTGTRANPVVATTASGIFGSDFTIGGTFYSTCVFGPDGTFAHLIHRGTTGIVNSFVALWQTAGNQAADTRNWYAIACQVNSARGAPQYGNLFTAANFSGRYPDGTLLATGGLRNPAFSAGAYASSFGQDFNSGNYLLDPLEVRELSPQVWDRGYMPDLYTIGTAPVGSSFPSIAAQTHMVIGDVLMPMPVGIIPTL